MNAKNEKIRPHNETYPFSPDWECNVRFSDQTCGHGYAVVRKCGEIVYRNNYPPNDELFADWPRVAADAVRRAKNRVKA